MRREHQVVVVGGGWAGVSAAIAAKKAGSDVAVVERTDMLLGAGLVGGIMRNNGRFVAAEESILLGFGDLFSIADDCSRHKGIEFPGHKHANLYDVFLIEPRVRAHLKTMGIPVYFDQRIASLRTAGASVISIESDKGDEFGASAFVDCTGSSGPPGLCQTLGHGCVACIQRCPAFGPRQSLTSLLGLPEFMSMRRKNVPGAMSGSCKIHKETLSKAIQRELDSKGCVVIPLPERLVKYGKLDTKVCQQYALEEYAENVVLLDTGHAKLMSPYMPLDDLRSLPGFEEARYADPLAGGKGNSIRLTAVSPRDFTMKVIGADNLFVAGERSGVIVGHTEAIVTGAVAGRNAALFVSGRPLQELPKELTVGDFIRVSAVDSTGSPHVEGGYGLNASHTFAGSVYFQRMMSLGLYTTDVDAIAKRVSESGFLAAFLT